MLQHNPQQNYQAHLLWPLLIAQSLGALNDNLFKTGVSVLLAYGVWNTAVLKPEIIISLAAALFTLPFILFAPLAGQLLQRFDERSIIRAIKAAEVLIVLLAAAALAMQSVLLALTVLFMLGTHSALLNPAKFSAVKQLMPPGRLLPANGLMNTGTFLAILAGNIGAGLIVLLPLGWLWLSALMLFLAVAGFLAASMMPVLLPPARHIWPPKWSFAPWQGARSVLRTLLQQKRPVFIAILGCAWFYFVGATLLTQLPNWTRHVLNADQHVFTLFMVLFSVGIALGSLLAGRWAKKSFVPAYFFGCGFFIICFVLASQNFIPSADVLTVEQFIHTPQSVSIMLSLLLISVCAGLFFVPLKTTIQRDTEDTARPAVLAASAYTDAVFIFAAAIISGALLSAGWGLALIFLGLGGLTLAWALFMYVSG